MNKNEELKVLVVSHWNVILFKLLRVEKTRQYQDIINIGIGEQVNCAYCREYYSIGAMRCGDGCPVRLKTGKSGCVDTPYKEVIEAKSTLINVLINLKFEDVETNMNQLIFQIKEEIKFLEAT